MIDWWTEVDGAILGCLEQAGPMSPADLARRVGISEGEATHFIAMLVREGKVRIGMVELNGPQGPASPRSRAPRVRAGVHPDTSGRRAEAGLPQRLRAAP